MPADGDAAYSPPVLVVEERSDPDPSRGDAQRAHALRFYADDAQLVGEIADFLAPAFDAEHGVLVVATDRHRLDLRSELRMRGIDVASAERSGRSLGLDASSTLRRVLRGGALDLAAFERVIGGAIDKVSAGSGQARVYGEMVSLLWLRGDPHGAVAMEDAWNRLLSRRGAALLCAYPARVLAERSRLELLLEITGAHGQIPPIEGLYPRV